MSMQEFADALYSNGVNPSGALQMEGKLSDAQLERLASNSRSHSPGRQGGEGDGPRQRREVAQISISPEDAEFLARRRFPTKSYAAFSVFRRRSRAT